MAPNEITRLMDAAPFEPFRLCVSDGTTYDIDAPHRLLVGNRSVHLGLPSTPGERLVDRVVRIDLLHITQLIPLQTPPHSPKGNGQAAG